MPMRLHVVSLLNFPLYIYICMYVFMETPCIESMDTNMTTVDRSAVLHTLRSQGQWDFSRSVFSLDQCLHRTLHNVGERLEVQPFPSPRSHPTARDNMTPRNPSPTRLLHHTSSLSEWQKTCYFTVQSILWNGFIWWWDSLLILPRYIQVLNCHY
jgi:hypothetical protein